MAVRCSASAIRGAIRQSERRRGREFGNEIRYDPVGRALSFRLSSFKDAVLGPLMEKGQLLAATFLLVCAKPNLVDSPNQATVHPNPFSSNPRASPILIG